VTGHRTAKIFRVAIHFVYFAHECSPLARLNRAVVEFTTGRHDPDAHLPQARPAEGYRVLPKFLSPDKTAGWLNLIESKGELFKTVAGKAGMSLPYNVLDGYKIDEHFPELREFALDHC